MKLIDSQMVEIKFIYIFNVLLLIL